jgi:hypothetical protein
MLTKLWLRAVGVSMRGLKRAVGFLLKPARLLARLQTAVLMLLIYFLVLPLARLFVSRAKLLGMEGRMSSFWGPVERLPRSLGDMRRMF